MLFQLISHTVNLLLHKINRRHFFSQKVSDSAVILAISVSKRCTLDLSVVKVRRRKGSIVGCLFFLTFCHSRNFFTDHFVTARVDFRIAFLIKFLSSSALLGFQKVLKQDAVSSSVAKEKFEICVRFDFLAYSFTPKMFFSYANFQHLRKHNCYDIY